MSRAIAFDKAQRRLASVWLSGCALILGVAIWRTIGDYYLQIQALWEWVLSLTVPTLTLVVGVMSTAEPTTRRVDIFPYRLALSLSSVYLALVLGILLFAASVKGGVEPSQLGAKTGLFLLPIQALMSLALGRFFFAKDR